VFDQGLAQSTEYCYSVSAYGITGESNLSNEVCATTLEIYLEEPQNLTHIEDGLEVTLDWDTPSSAIGIGDECITAYEQAGFIDCSGICFEASLADTWIGDGFCDDGNNNEICHFDGGDCCGLSVKKNFCVDCECIGKFKNSNSNCIFGHLK
jgi:hypothetical protein